MYEAAIIGMGVVSPVGLDAEQTASSVRAGTARKQESSIMDERFEPIVVQLSDPELSECTNGLGLEAEVGDRTHGALGHGVGHTRLEQDVDQLFVTVGRDA